MYVPITMSLLCMAAMTIVECCVLKRAKGLTDESRKPVTIVGTMGNTVKLPGYLESPNQPFYKDNKDVLGSEHIYELTNTPVGYQVNIRFLTCTDEGNYRIGSETFYLSAKAATCGMFYYTAKVDKGKKAAFVGPLDGVITIAMLYIEPEDSHMWSLLQVWNDTMSRKISPAPCCFMVNNTFGGYGDREYRYFMYQRLGQADSSCANVQQLAASPRATTVTTTPGTPMMEMPALKEFEDMKTSVKLLDVSEAIRDVKRMIDDFERSWKSAGTSEGSTLQTRSSILTPLYITMAMLMVAI